MANQEGVKIVITAEDRFTENIKKIEASTKIFGETAKNTERYLAALEKEMIRLVANGLDPADKKIVEMRSNYDKLSQSLNSSQGSLKESNRQWTNLALVVQDLPYGFRGIQNNLPALIGGVAGLAGPIYLLGSAVIAFFTAWDAGIISFSDGADSIKKYTKDLQDSFVAETTVLSSLYRVATNVNATNEERLLAVKSLKKEYPGLLSNYSDEDIMLGKAKDAYTKLTATLWQYAKAKAAENAVAELAKKSLAIDLKIADEEANMPRRYAEGQSRATSAYLLAQGRVYNLRQEQAGLNKELEKYQAILDKNVTSTQKKTDIQDDSAIKAAAEASRKQAEKSRKLAEEAAKNRIAANKAETDAYIQTLDERGQKEYKAGLELANNLEKMRLAGYTDSTTYYAAYRAEMANIAKYYDDKELKEQKKENDKELKESILFAKKQTDIIKTQSDVEQKLYSGNLVKQQSALKANMAKLAILAANTFDPQVAQVYLDMFDKLNAKLTGLGENWDKTSQKINSAIQDVLVNSFSLLGESLGKALAGDNVDLISSFGLLIADALVGVGKSLIEYAILVGLAMELFSNPLTWPVALAAGIAAVAAGAFLKSQLSKKDTGNTPKFANGGIVSGPTLGLMGEYPGARSNPEVIAPLDKLKGLIGGGGGGTLTARISGNDLLILMNKASRTNSTTF